jgi:hypothetical protein
VGVKITELQLRYLRGEITFAEYRAQWLPIVKDVAVAHVTANGEGGHTARDEFRNCQAPACKELR